MFIEPHLDIILGIDDQSENCRVGPRSTPRGIDDERTA
jgi:hypothetical protein